MTLLPETSLPRHGGDLAYATARYGLPEDGWLDLSTGINPEPYPAPPVETASLARLPDRDAHDALIDAARGAYGFPPSASLIATPGSEVALRLLPLVAPAGPVAIVGPTYGSHREAWTNAARELVDIAKADDLSPEAAVVVLANPNNPDGRTVAAAKLAGLAGKLGAHGGLLVVDEAFADLDPDISLAPFLETAPAIVLRSFGKFFGHAGLRLGFAAGPAATVDRLARLLGDWPVSSAALAIGRMALADTGWQAATRAALAEKSKRLRHLLQSRGLTVAGGTALFVLVAHPDAVGIHVKLAEAGIWTRAFAERPDRLRIGLPPHNAALARLEETLAAVTSPSTG